MLFLSLFLSLCPVSLTLSFLPVSGGAPIHSCYHILQSHRHEERRSWSGTCESWVEEPDQPWLRPQTGCNQWPCMPVAVDALRPPARGLLVMASVSGEHVVCWGLHGACQMGQAGPLRARVRRRKGFLGTSPAQQRTGDMEHSRDAAGPGQSLG